MLQRAPQAAAVYGSVAGASRDTTVTIMVQDAGQPPYSVAANVSDAHNGTADWKAILKSHEGGGNVTLTATCSQCADAAPAVLRDVTFGDIWICSGQVG